MICVKITYMIAVLVTAFIVIMYPGSVPPVLLGLELGMAAGSLLFLFVLLPGIQVNIKTKKQVVFAKEEWIVPVIVKNNSYLPASRMKIRIMIQDHITKQKQFQEVFLKLSARDQINTELVMNSDFCGVVEVQVQSCRIYEPFCLFGWTKRKISSYKQVILPRLIEANVRITDQNRYFLGDAEEYDTRRPGDDPSEVLKFRAYMYGDRMSQVNWKMSARKNTLLVKERSLPLDCTTELMIDTRYTSWRQADALLTVVYSISWAFLQQNLKHRISWYQDHAIVSYVVAKEEELIEIIRKMLLVPAQENNWRIQAWMEQKQNEVMYERILFSDLVCQEEVDFIFQECDSKKQVVFLIQEEERNNQLLKEQYGENCYEIHAWNIEQELPSIWLQI